MSRRAILSHSLVEPPGVALGARFLNGAPAAALQGECPHLYLPDRSPV